MIIDIINYSVTGFLFIRFLVTLYNYLSKPYLPIFNQNSSLKELSVLIPARNEATNIGNLLMQFKAISVKEIIVLDDNSTDDTKFIALQYSFLNKNIQIIDGKSLPNGWLGKNWACDQLASQATGKYLLFLDADVEITENGIKNAVLQFQKSEIAMLSLFPSQKMETFGEKLVVPLMHYLLLTLLPLKLVKTSKFSSLSAANGQFMLFDAQVYKNYNFHSKVKNTILDDVAIFRLAKNMGLKCQTLLANNQIKCRMYKSFSEGVEGFSKNLYLGFGKNMFVFLGYFFLIYIGFIVVFFTSNYIFILTNLILIFSIRLMISKCSNQASITNILLHFLQMNTYVFIGFKSIFVHTFGKINWKNRVI